MFCKMFCVLQISILWKRLLSFLKMERVRVRVMERVMEMEMETQVAVDESCRSSRLGPHARYLPTLGAVVVVVSEAVVSHNVVVEAVVSHIVVVEAVVSHIVVVETVVSHVVVVVVGGLHVFHKVKMEMEMEMESDGVRNKVNSRCSQHLELMTNRSRSVRSGRRGSCSWRLDHHVRGSLLS